MRRPASWIDALILAGLGVLLYFGMRLSVHAPDVITGPTISLSPTALPYYALLSVGRMLAAYILSLAFTLVYGSVAAHNARAERVLMPVLDVLQSVPILSFLPVVVLGLSALLPEGIAVELASIVLIFTSQVWNLTFAWYQSLTTVPKELREAASIFGLNRWLRFRYMEFPFATLSVVWNSVMSWAGGWFFLMAAEIFTVGDRDFRLRGLGAYLQEAANSGNAKAIIWGVGTLVLVIVALDQLVWRPLLAWAERFKLETVTDSQEAKSWLYDASRDSRLMAWLSNRVLGPLGELLDGGTARRFPGLGAAYPEQSSGRSLAWLWAIPAVAGLGYGAYLGGGMLLELSASQWGQMLVGLTATLLRVALSLALALAWTIPVGVAIGTNPRLSGWLQPLVQVMASIPATALFPVFLFALLAMPAGLDLAAIMVMLLGSQWYLLFNIIAGASAIPLDLRYTTALLQLSRWDRWRTLLLPALFPYVVTGAITASGGAWNASIVAEYVEFGGATHETVGIGAIVARATAVGDFPLLMASTLVMVASVVIINRVLWRRLYRLAEERYRME